MVDARDLPAGRQAQNLTTHMYYVYALKSKNYNYIYVGISNNPQRRIREHNKRYNRTTKFYTPFITLLIEKHDNRQKARIREKYLKSGCGKEYLKSL